MQRPGPARSVPSHLLLPQLCRAWRRRPLPGRAGCPAAELPGSGSALRLQQRGPGCARKPGGGWHRAQVYHGWLVSLEGQSLFKVPTPGAFPGLKPKSLLFCAPFPPILVPWHAWAFIPLSSSIFLLELWAKGLCHWFNPSQLIHHRRPCCPRFCF